MDAALGGLLPVDFLSCDLSEDDHGLGSSHDDEPTSSQGSPLSPMLTMTEGPEEIQIAPSNNSAGDGSGDEQNQNDNTTGVLQRDYVNRGSELWNHWEWLGGTGKMSLMKCNYCSNKQLKNAPKCRRHLIKCPGTPDNIRRIFEKREMEANRVSAMMREIRDKGIKVSRAAAGAHLLANDLPTAITSTPQPTKIQISNSLLNNSAPASILKSSIIADTIAGTAAGASDDNSTARGGRRKRKNNNTNNNNNTVAQISNTPSRLPNFCRTSVGFDLVKTMSAPYHAQSTVPPLPSSISQQTSTLTLNKFKSVNSSTSSQINPPADYLLQNSQDAQTAAAAVAALTGGTNPLLCDPKLLAMYLAAFPLLNNNNSKNVEQQMNIPAKSSAANIAAVLNGTTTNSLKRKNSSTVNNGRENSILLNQTLNLPTKNGKENKQKKAQNNNNNNNNNINNIINTQVMNGNPVLIHVDDTPRIDEALFFPATVTPPPPLEPVKSKKARTISNDNNIVDIKAITKQQYETTTTTTAAAVAKQNSNKIRKELNQTELNDLLASAFLSAGIDFDFVKNPFLQEFVQKLSNLSLKNYRVPTSEELITSNLSNLARKFDSDISLLFREADSIIVSFDSINKYDSNDVITYEKMNINLLIQRSEEDSKFLYKHSDLSEFEKDLNKQIDLTVNMIEPHRIDSVILPYENPDIAERIQKYFLKNHPHIAPLTNAYQLYDRMLADICRVEPIRIVLQQCIAMFQVFVRYFKESDENRVIWTKVFTSQHLMMYHHLMTDSDDSKLYNSRYWFSVHMMLHWFLVAKTDLPERISKAKDCSKELNVVMKKINLDDNDISKFFDRIDALFHFLTPFILAIHKIQFESSVISDVVKVFYDLKGSFINNLHIMRNMDSICENEASRAILDKVLTRYIQDENFSDFYFLAYYLDPRYKHDKQIEETDDLIRRIHCALELYSNALGCHGDTENDDSSQMTKSLTEVISDFRNDVKMFFNSGSTQSPAKYWREMSRYQMPGVTQLAFCASRLLSISTNSLLLSAQEYLLNTENDTQDDLRLTKDDKHTLTKSVDPRVMDQLLPIKNYLCREQNNAGNNRTGTKVSFSRESLAQTVSNVICTLDAFNCFLSRPQSSIIIQPLQSCNPTASTSPILLSPILLAQENNDTLEN